MEREMLFRWNGHNKTIYDAFSAIREKKKFCDATIACEGNFYPVHRFVISTCSLYFEKILEYVNDSNPVIVLADIKAKNLESLLQYMYTGEVTVFQEDVDNLIKAGVILKIKGISAATGNEDNEQPKRQSNFLNNRGERPEKRQRTVESSDTISLINSSRLPNFSANSVYSSGGGNDDGNSKEMKVFSDPLNQSEEEILQPCGDSLFIPESQMKSEIIESVTDQAEHSQGQNNEQVTHNDFASQSLDNSKSSVNGKDTGNSSIGNNNKRQSSPYGIFQSTDVDKSDSHAKKKRQKIQCPHECSQPLQNVEDLRNHLTNIHGEEMTETNLYFTSNNEFKTWKQQYEDSVGIHYSLHRQPFRSKHRTSSIYYCGRSGYLNSRGEGKRSGKSQGTAKIGGHCTSQIKVYEYHATGEYKVTVFNEHCGHKLDFETLCYTPLCKQDKDTIAAKLSQNVPKNDILEYIRNNGANRRSKIVTPQDLLNVARDYQLSNP